MLDSASVALELALWIAAAFLAIVFVLLGARKLIQPRAELVETMPWAADFSSRSISAIAIVEIVGALGLLLPELTLVLPELTVVAAFGLAALQGAAIVVHVRRGERNLWLNLVLLGLALFVAVGRIIQ